MTSPTSATTPHIPAQQSGPNQHPVEPIAANLLDLRATVEPGGRHLTGSEDQIRDYLGAVDGYAAALNAVHNAYKKVDDEQLGALGQAQTRFNEQVYLRAVRLAAERGRANDNPDLTIDQLSEQCLMEEFSYGIVATARAEAALVSPDVRERGSRIAAILGNRWVRRGIYTAAILGGAVGLLSGAWAPMLVAGGIGSVTGMVGARVAGGIRGRNVANIARDHRNTRAAVEMRNNRMLQAINLPREGETSQEYMTRVHGALEDSAVSSYDTNRDEMRARIREGIFNRSAGQTVLDAVRGFVVAFGGAGWANYIGGVLTGYESTPSGGEVTTEAAQRAIAEYKANVLTNAIQSGNPDVLSSIDGLNNYDFATLEQMAAENGGHYAWNGADNIIPGDGGEAEFLQQGYDATRQLQANGVDVAISKVTQPDGDWFYRLDVGQSGGLVVLKQVAVDGVEKTNALFIPEGSIHGGAQAEFFKAIMGADEILTYDQALARLGEAAQVTTESVGEVVAETWLAWAAAAGVAGGATSAALRDGYERRQLPADATPAALAVGALTETRRERSVPMLRYLQRPRVQAFIQALPAQNQAAYVRMVNNMTTIPRAAIAAQLQLSQQLIDQMEDEDADQT